MPEADTQGEKDFHLDVPAATAGFFLKGSGASTGACRTGWRGSSARSPAGP